MIKIEHYSSLEEAFDTCMTKDHDHILIRHSYRKGTKIHPHKHDAYEWVIATHGHFIVESEGDQKEFKLEGSENRGHSIPRRYRARPDGLRRGA